MDTKIDCFVSVIVPVYEDADIIEAFIHNTIHVLEQNFTNHELLIIDDGSTGQTVPKIQALLSRYRGIRLIQLSRRFGTEVAISAGMESVIGDFVVVMLPYMDPPELIRPLVERARSGVDVVFGVRENAGNVGWFYQCGSELFHWYVRRYLGIKLPQYATQLRCLSRKALNSLTQIKDYHRYLRLYSTYVGYAQQEFSYTPLELGSGKHRRNFMSAVNTCIDLIIENSKHPLRMVTWACVGAALLNCAYLLLIVAIYFFKPDVTPGWTSLSFQNAFQFLLISLMLTILSEYTGRILERLGDRPFYYVTNEQTSSVLLSEKEKYNIVTDSPEVAIVPELNIPSIKGAQR